MRLSLVVRRLLRRVLTAAAVGASATLGALLVASPAQAQANDPGRTLSQVGGGEVSADTGYYIPGMPVPEQETAAEGETGTTQGRKGGRIGKVTRVERAGDSLRTPTQPGIDREQLQPGEIYSGIVPGIRDWHLLARRAREAAKKNQRIKNRVTWVGFQDLDAGSRVFVQTIREAGFRVEEGVADDGRAVVTVTLLGTRVPIYNNRRTLDTRYFPTAVIGADATPVGPNTVVTIVLQSTTRYAVRQEGEFIFIDFDDDGTKPYADASREADGTN